MGAVWWYSVILALGAVGFIAGLGRMLVIVGAVLMGKAVLASPGGIARVLRGLPVGLSPQTVSMASTALGFIGLPALAAVLMRAVYNSLRLPGFVDRVLGAVLGGVVGVALRQ